MAQCANISLDYNLTAPKKASATNVLVSRYHQRLKRVYRVNKVHTARTAAPRDTVHRNTPNVFAFVTECRPQHDVFIR